ncbi:hypothetical protein [Aureimonas sp. ME7]|uniref:hypothetical protein n=1 Tax=Aureimonas sp. ME7 TaxID=2744252 RepID=UPI0015F36D20|nr:hypothetical protein [Aureimonas sp. ME7]
MSEHTIEDLVEDGIRLALASPLSPSAKRDLARELYAFQALYDTSDTRGRLAAELESIGYDEARPARPRPWLDLVADIARLADGAGDRQLVRGWLGALAAGIDEWTLIDADWPPDFPAFAESPSALAIRETATRCDVFARQERSRYGKLPTYRALAQGYEALDPRTIDRRTMLRFLLDHKAEPARIRADYDKERARIAAMASSALFDLPALVEARGAFRLVGREKLDDRHVFAFETGPVSADPDAFRMLLVLEHLQPFNTLHMFKAVRSPLLARWQGKHFTQGDADVHFRRGMLHFIPRERLDAQKHLDAMGWRYRMDQSARVLGQRIDSMLALSGFGRRMDEFYAVPLGRRIDEEGFDAMAGERLQRLERFGFFADEVDILFACACRSWDRGTEPKAEIAGIEEHLAHIRPDAPGRGDRVAALRALRSGPAFAPALARFPYRRHEEAFAL